MLPSGKRSVVFKPTESTGGLVALPHKLPCGQCVGCRLDYSLDWAVRCVREASLHEKNCFITLTYDDVHLPKDRGLVKKDFQKFMKRLRRRFGRVRFFHAGEYGEKYGRPHYHALLFGFDFPDRKILRESGSGAIISSSDILSDVWGKGYCSVGDVTFESAAYVARYCMKKVNGKAKEVVDERSGLCHYERRDEVTGEVLEVSPEYVTMSRRPGIGRAWYERFKSDVYPHDYSVIRGGVRMPPPRYFDHLYELENPVDMDRIKKLRCSRNGRREVVWNDILRKEQLLPRDRSDRLAVLEECQLLALKKLKRTVDND